MRSDCDRWQGLLSAWLDRELAAGPAAELSRHLEACAGCRQELAGIAEVAEALAVRTQPDPLFVMRFRGRVSEDPFLLPGACRALALRLMPFAAAAVLVAWAAVWASLDGSGIEDLEARALGQVALEDSAGVDPVLGVALEPRLDMER